MSMNRRKFAACVAGLVGLPVTLWRGRKLRKSWLGYTTTTAELADVGPPILSHEMMELMSERMREVKATGPKYVVCRPDQIEAARQIFGVNEPPVEILGAQPIVVTRYVPLA